MIAYYLMVLLPVAVSLLCWQYRVRVSRCTKQNNIAIAVFFAIYFLLLALRHKTIGSDTGGYFNSFEQIKHVGWLELLRSGRSDIGFYLLSKLISTFFPSYQVNLAIIAALTVIPLGYLYHRESEGPLLSMVLFLTFPVFMMYFSGQRQALAIALGVPAFYMAKDRKLLKYLLIVLLAFLIHHSAFALLLIYPMFRAKFRPKHLLWLIPAYMVTLLLNSALLKRIMDILAVFLGEKYTDYEISDTGAYTMIILLALFLVYSFFMPSEKEMDETTRALRNLLIVALFIQMFTPISSLTMRINYYFLIFVPLLIPRVTNRCARFDRRILTVVKTAFFLFFAVYFFHKATTIDSLNIYPYIPFWS